MSYKILEQNGIANENVDGAAFNNFTAGGRNGIIKGILSECRIFSPASNVLGVSTGEILVHGFRVKLLEDQIFSMASAPDSDVPYHLVMEITLNVSRAVDTELFCRPVESLVQENLYEREQGIYQVEIARFVYASDGTIKDISKTLEVMSGPAGELVPDGLKTEEDANGDTHLWLTHKGTKFGTPVLLPYMAGGGGGDISTDLRLTSLSDLQFIAPVGGTSNIRYQFVSRSGSKGTVKVYVNEALRETKILDEGEHTLDISKYVVSGTTNIRINVTTTIGASASLEYLVTGVELKLSSTFNDAEAYTGDITFRYTVTGEVEKAVQFELDGEKLEPVIVNSSRQQVYTIPALSHGVHTLKVSASAVIDGTTLHSNELNFNIISYVSGNNTTIISSKFNTKNATQGDIISIDYVVFNPASLTAPVNLKINGGIVQTLTVGRTRQYWNINDLVVGDNILIIESGTVSKSFEISIAESDFKLEPVTDQLELYLDAFGRSNSEENRDVWTYGQYSAEFVDFNWSTNGWINNALRLNGKARLNIPFNIFGKDFRGSGKTIEFEFATRDVATIDTIAIISYANSRGIRLKMNEALLQSEQSSVTTKYKDEERVRVSFVIEDKSGLRLIKTFINGVMSGLAQYPADDNFAQSTPVGITVNPEGGSIDLYTVRIYNIDLSDTDMLNNYVADLDVLADRKQVAAVNDILSAGEVSYAKVRSKIATVVLTGQLPSVKGDKKGGKVSFEDPLNASRNFEQNCVIDVQGTSSQFYPRKNWKIKLSTPIDFFNNGFEEKTYTIKVNYMESSNSHNTGIARYIQGDSGQIYTEKVPPQQLNDNVRTVINGEPIALFHRATETSTPKFYAIGDFNNDKGNATVLGLTDAYPNAESWEFKDNDELLCLFRTNDFSRNENAFEARYPDENKNFTQIDAVVGWVYSTQGNLTKFRDEFEQHFNLHYTLVYYVLTEMFGMVDSRAKNLFLNTWDGKIWYPVFYDLDTAFGLNNEGVNAFSYNIEYNDVIGTQNVYNGSSSVLWNNLKDAFADEIQELYTSFRSNGKLSYDKVLSALDEVTAPFSKALYNADGDAKYVGPLEEDNNSTYLYAAQGDRKEHLKWWLDKRFNYLDSKYQASDYANDYISMRLYSPASDLVIPFDGKFILKSFIAQYLSVRYGANAELIKVRANAEEETILQAREGADLNDKETTLYGASNIKDLGDLSNKYVGTLDVSKASKLSRLVVGSSKAGYSNTNLISLNIGNNKLLTYLDVRNCPNLTQDIDISGCENIKEIYATGTSTAAVKLAEGGNLETMTLPETITNLTVKNQPLLTNITIAGVTNVSTLVVENVNSSIDEITKNILLNGQNLSRVRLIGFYWTFSTASEILELLDKLNGVGGIDENNANTDRAILSGTFYIHSIVSDEVEEIRQRYPEINLVYDVLGVRVKFYNGDILLSEQVYAPGEQISLPEDPEKESTVEKEYSFAGWSLDGVNIIPSLGAAGETSVNYYAVFNEAPRRYTIRFLNSDGSELQAVDVPYGEIPVYQGDTPVDPVEGYDSSFNGWYPEITAVTGEAEYRATYITPPKLSYTLNSDKASYTVSGIGTVTDTDIIIPGYYRGLPVTSIGYNAFKNNTSLTSITIPDSLTSIGSYAFSGCSGLTSVCITNIVAWCNISFSVESSNPLSYAKNLYLNNELVTELVIPDGVTRISQHAFSYCKSLTSVVIPDSVRYISNYAFSYCANLTSVTIGNSVTSIGQNAFNHCSSLTSIIIPDSVTSIGWNSFNGCRGLTSVTIGNSVTSIDDAAFYGCSSLTSINIPDGVTKIGQNAFGNCTSLTSVHITDIAAWCNINFKQYNNVYSNPLQYAKKLYLNGQLVTDIVIPDSVTTINDAVFKDCTSLTSITIPDSVTSIGAYAFSGCSGLTSINIPDGVTKIGQNTFYGCSSLTSVTIPDSVTSIGNSAFQYCRGLTGVIYIPDSVTSLGSNVFYRCTGLTGVTIPNSVTSIGAEAFRGCSNLTSVEIPDGVTSIGNWAFTECNSLTSVTIPGNITSLGNSILSSCESLTSVIIGNGVTSISRSMFYGCSKLSSITIPDSVTSIYESAFSNCSGLTSVTIGNGVNLIDKDAFYGCSRLTGVYITDMTAWCNILFTGNHYANPLYLAKKLYLNNTLVTELVIPDGVTTISYRAFIGCTSLTSLTIPDSVTSIGQYAFMDCTGLTSIAIPNSVNPSIGKNVTSIGASAFQNCTGLTGIIYIPDSVTSIGSSAFKGCAGLTYIFLSDNLTSISDSTFSGCTSLLDIGVIPDSVTSIGTEAFSGCTRLGAITFGDGVTSIGSKAFYLCTGFGAISIPNNVTSIDNYAFSGCNNVESILIGSGVTSIGSQAFDCAYTHNYGVIISAINPPTAGIKLFGTTHVSKLSQIFVPVGSGNTYKSATNWSDYADKIIEET